MNLQRKQQLKLDKRTEKRLQQLSISLFLFSLVFVGQGVFPQRFTRTRDIIQENLVGTTDFHLAFQNLGSALAKETLELQDLETFCQEVFGSGGLEQEEAVMVFQPMAQYVPPTGYFSLETPWEEAVFVLGQEEIQSIDEGNQEEYVDIPEEIPEELPVEIPEEPMAIGTILESHDPQDLPENHTYDFIYLGERDYISPVYTTVTSEFGMRVGPLTGVLAMHRGVDLWATTGTPIVSWSDGVVEAVGETSEVGLYVRVNHGDDIITFYAHCSEILVKEGQIVTMGEEIALVGATGKVTGAHLHFELRWKEEYLNPLLYMEYEGQFD